MESVTGTSSNSIRYPRGAHQPDAPRDLASRALQLVTPGQARETLICGAGSCPAVSGTPSTARR
jgi:hypothetical protein